MEKEKGKERKRKTGKTKTKGQGRTLHIVCVLIFFQFSTFNLYIFSHQTIPFIFPQSSYYLFIFSHLISCDSIFSYFFTSHIFFLFSNVLKISYLQHKPYVNKLLLHILPCCSRATHRLVFLVTLPFGTLASLRRF